MWEDKELLPLREVHLCDHHDFDDHGRHGPRFLGETLED